MRVSYCMQIASLIEGTPVTDVTLCSSGHLEGSCMDHLNQVVIGIKKWELVGCSYHHYYYYLAIDSFWTAQLKD